MQNVNGSMLLKCGCGEDGKSELKTVTNEKVLENVGENKCLLEKSRSRKRNWVGHVLRGEGLMREERRAR